MHKVYTDGNLRTFVGNTGDENAMYCLFRITSAICNFKNERKVLLLLLLLFRLLPNPNVLTSDNS